jgi:hypothetical protein
LINFFVICLAVYILNAVICEVDRVLFDRLRSTSLKKGQRFSISSNLKTLGIFSGIDLFFCPLCVFLFFEWCFFNWLSDGWVLLCYGSLIEFFFFLDFSIFGRFFIWLYFFISSQWHYIQCNMNLTFDDVIWTAIFFIGWSMVHIGGIFTKSIVLKRKKEGLHISFV